MNRTAAIALADAVPRKTWDVLLQVARDRGHKQDPGESEFDFLQRIIRECATESERRPLMWQHGEHCPCYDCA